MHSHLLLLPTCYNKWAKQGISIQNLHQQQQRKMAETEKLIQGVIDTSARDYVWGIQMEINSNLINIE